MTFPEELDAILVRAPDHAETDIRQELLDWAARMAIWARIDEVNKFATAGIVQSLREDDQITGYFVGGLEALAEEMENVTQRQAN
jgi:hypothetical protein